MPTNPYDGSFNFYHNSEGGSGDSPTDGEQRALQVVMIALKQLAEFQESFKIIISQTKKIKMLSSNPILKDLCDSIENECRNNLPKGN